MYLIPGCTKISLVFTYISFYGIIVHKEASHLRWDERIMNIDDNEAYNDIIANAEYELIEAVRNYSKAFVQSSAENNGVPTINQIEKMWSKLDSETRNIFVNMISGSISSINESELISSKKENT